MMPQLRKNRVVKLIRILMGKYDLSNILYLKTHLQKVAPVPIQNKTDIKTYGFFKLGADESKLICRTSFAFIPYKITLGMENGLLILPTFRRRIVGAIDIVFLSLLIFVSLTFIMTGMVEFLLAIGFVLLFFSILIIHTIVEKRILLRGLKKACEFKLN